MEIFVSTIGTLCALLFHLQRAAAGCSTGLPFMLNALGYAVLWAEFFLVEVVGVVLFILLGPLGRGWSLVAVTFLAITILLAFEISCFLQSAPACYAYPVIGLLSTVWLLATSLLLRGMTPTEFFAWWPNPPFSSPALAVLTPAVRLLSNLRIELYCLCKKAAAVRKALGSDSIAIEVKRTSAGETLSPTSPQPSPSLADIFRVGPSGVSTFSPSPMPEEDAAREIKWWQEFNHKRLDKYKSEEQYAAEHAELLAYIMSFNIPRKPRKLHPSTLFPIDPASTADTEREDDASSAFTIALDEVQVTSLETIWFSPESNDSPTPADKLPRTFKGPSTATPSAIPGSDRSSANDVLEGFAHASKGVSLLSPVTFAASEADEIPYGSINDTFAEPALPPARIHTQAPSPVERPESPHITDQSESVTSHPPQHLAVTALQGTPLPIEPSISPSSTRVSTPIVTPQKKTVHFVLPEAEPVMPIPAMEQQSQHPITPLNTKAPTHSSEHPTALPEDGSMLNNTPLAANPLTAMVNDSILQTQTVVPTPNVPLNILNTLDMSTSGWPLDQPIRNQVVSQQKVLQAPTPGPQHVQSSIPVPANHLMQQRTDWQPPHVEGPVNPATHSLGSGISVGVPQHIFFQRSEPAVAQDDVEMGGDSFVGDAAGMQDLSVPSTMVTQVVPVALKLLPSANMQSPQQTIPQHNSRQTDLQAMSQAAQHVDQPLPAPYAEQANLQENSRVPMITQSAMLEVNELMAKMDVDSRRKAWDYITTLIWPQKPVSEEIVASALEIPFDELPALTEERGFELSQSLRGIIGRASRDRRRAASATLSPSVPASRSDVAPISSTGSVAIDPALLNPTPIAPAAIAQVPVVPVPVAWAGFQPSNLFNFTPSAGFTNAGRRIAPIRGPDARGKKRGGLR